ncbi:uncharacterized protein PRCAT00004576001 [Priceomyces carsonii]|uniref:uncharacterized protein n=1 Tax=Priceomyces carsonii TaxID=28549 RepID=UPI002EDADF8B|nr:unnamed protein product [Priceomyces carsonii]
MDAGTAAASTQKGRLRQQLLSENQDINMVNNLRPEMQPMQQFQQQSYGGYNGYDMMGVAPVVATPVSEGRKGSITTTGMQKFFKRNKSGGQDFNDDFGADVQDITHNSNLSFDDISHIRNRGPYGMTGTSTLDTTPIIPTIGPGTPGKPTTSNIQYRKQMNQSKKMAMMSGARAMSLAGGNPMQSQGYQADPRTMSLSSNGMALDPRTMSLSSNGTPAPRAMSLNNRPMGNFNYAAGPPNGPRMMSMRNNGGYGVPAAANQTIPPGPRAMSLAGPQPDPRAMSLSNNNYQFASQGSRAMSLAGRPQPDPRTMSLSNNGSQFAPQGPRTMSLAGGPQQGPQGPRTMSLSNGTSNFRPMNNQYHLAMRPPQSHQFQQQGYQYNSSLLENMQFPKGSHPSSNDSLMNVVEEDEENTISRNNLQKHKDFEHTSSSAFDEQDEDDVVYKFDQDESESLSRKSTIKKSNSMRLRKLNLFNQGDESEEFGTNEQRYSPQRKAVDGLGTNVSPLFNLTRLNMNRESIVNNEVDYNEMLEQREKFKSLGATAGANNSNATTLTKDVFLTASEFLSPEKRSQLKESPLKTYSPMKNDRVREDEYENENDTSTLKGRGSPVAEEQRPIPFTSKPLPKQPSIRSLTANTAFDNFRTDSSIRSPHVKRFEESQGSVNKSLVYDSDDSENEKEVNLGAETYQEELESRHEQHQEQFDSTSLYSEKSLVVIEDPMAHFSTRESLSNRLSSDKSALTNSRENYSSPLTSNTSKFSNNYNEGLGNNFARKEEHIPFNNYSVIPNNRQVQSTVSNSRVPNAKRSSLASELNSQKKDRHSRSFSLTNKSKDIFKRLSKSSRRASASNESKNNAFPDDSSSGLRRSSFMNKSTVLQLIDKGRRSSGGQFPPLTPSSTSPLKFSKDEMAIMSCNNDLLHELQLVTTELASSIKRELTLESQLKNNSPHLTSLEASQYEVIEKLRIIADLQDKLNKERRLRFISEEHALLLENGQSPSPLKLNYEKTEIYKQLLFKNDLVNQLQDKLDEYESGSREKDNSLWDKYNELLKENTELKLEVIPQMEKKFSSRLQQVTQSTSNRELSLVDNSLEYQNDEYQGEVMTLKNQRDELREAVTKLNASHNYEMKLANDKLASLNNKLQSMKVINEKLSKRIESGEKKSKTSSTLFNKGGKLQGFHIINPNRTLSDD